jgi:hypothetical protein
VDTGGQHGKICCGIGIPNKTKQHGHVAENQESKPYTVNSMRKDNSDATRFDQMTLPSAGDTIRN